MISYNQDNVQIPRNQRKKKFFKIKMNVDKNIPSEDLPFCFDLPVISTQ